MQSPGYLVTAAAAAAADDDDDDDADETGSPRSRLVSLSSTRASYS